MQYLLLIHGDESQWATMTEEETSAIMGEYFAYTEWLSSKGIMRGGNALQPTAVGRTVRVRDGERLVTDGPYAETREQLAGYFMVECDSLEEAIDAAARIPGARHGAIEVRPVAQFDDAS
jgi:hypothetical protein